MPALKPKVFGPFTPDADDADGYAQSQTPAAGGEQTLTLNGALVTDGVGEPDIPRRVLITAVGNESGRTFTVTGTDHHGNTISEEVTGPNATTAFTELDFKTVTEVTVDDDTANAVTVGTNEVFSTPWVPLNQWVGEFNVSVTGIVTGTINYGFEFTNDDVFNSTGPFQVFADANVTNETDNQTGQITSPCAAVRAIVNSYTDGATFKAIIRQSG